MLLIRKSGKRFYLIFLFWSWWCWSYWWWSSGLRPNPRIPMMSNVFSVIIERKRLTGFANKKDISLKKWTIPGLFFIYFRLSKCTSQILQQINVKKCPSSIRCWDSNPRPLKHESPPITSRPGLLLPKKNILWWLWCRYSYERTSVWPFVDPRLELQFFAKLTQLNIMTQRFRWATWKHSRVFILSNSQSDKSEKCLKLQAARIWVVIKRLK